MAEDITISKELLKERLMAKRDKKDKMRYVDMFLLVTLIILIGYAYVEGQFIHKEYYIIDTCCGMVNEPTSWGKEKVNLTEWNMQTVAEKVNEQQYHQMKEQEQGITVTKR